MNGGNVAAFGCGRLHPQLGDKAPCVRARHHPGDHRAEHDGKLKVWPDPVTPFDVPRVLTLSDHDGDPLPVDTFPEPLVSEQPRIGPAVLELEEPRLLPLLEHQPSRADRAVTVAAWLVLAALLSVWPFVVVLLAREAF